MEPENLPEIRNCVVENINFAATIKSSYIKLFMNVIKALNFVDNTEIQLSAEGLVSSLFSCFEFHLFNIESHFRNMW